MVGIVKSYIFIILQRGHLSKKSINWFIYKKPKFEYYMVSNNYHNYDSVSHDLLIVNFKNIYVLLYLLYYYISIYITHLFLSPSKYRLINL